MKFKALLAMLVAGTMLVSAQSQGYQDGVEYYKAGQYENAKTILLNTMSNPSTNQALANYYLGQTYLALGDKATALAYFQKGQEADMNCAYNYVGLGAVALVNGDVKAARDYFKEAQRLAKKDYEVLVAIARAYYNVDPVAYAQDIDKLLAKAHKDSKHKEPSIYILEGDMLAANGDFGGAAGKYEMAISFDNTNPEGYVKYANCYFHINPQFAIAKLEEFLQIAPNSALAQRELAEKYFMANYWKKAAEQYGRYIQNPNHFPEDKARYSVLLFYGEDYEGALRVANEVIAIQPDNFQCLRVRILCEAQLERFDQVVAHGAQFFAAFPAEKFNANDYVVYADALSKTGNDAESLQVLEKAINTFPEDAGLLYTLSAVYAKDEATYLQAAELYDRYLAVNETASLSDYMTATGRWLMVAAKTDDLELRASAAQKGIAHIDYIMTKAQPSAFIFQRKARLYIAGDPNRQPNAEAIATYMDMIQLLDQDPANADANNPNNYLSLYKEAYMFAVVYYNSVLPDEEQLAIYREKLAAVKAALGE